jgi:signal transduction histidine kinase/DNA-binding response OmpR family regulator/ligand-binding sensor domain-containing protein
MGGGFSLSWKIILGMLCSLASLSVYGQQNWQLNHLSTEDGLSQGMIYTILQDSDGFIWMGTKDGLNRYDGTTFKVFTNEPENPASISGNTVTALYEDSKGYIWAASQNAGLNIYDKKTGIFHHIYQATDQQKGLSGNDVWEILEDDKGNFILSISGMELNIFSLEDAFFEKGTLPEIQRVRLPLQSHPLPNEPYDIRNIYKDNENKIFVVGDEYLYQLDIADMSVYQVAPTDSSFYDMYFQEDGSTWAFRRNGQLFYLDDNDTIGIANFGIRHLDFTVEGGAQYVLHRDFLRYFKFNASTKEIPTYQAVNVGESPGVMIKDRSGLLWVGTKGYGIFTLNTKARRFSHLARGQSVSSLFIFDNKLTATDFSPVWFHPEGEAIRVPGKEHKADLLKAIPLSANSTFYKYFVRGPNQYLYEKKWEGKKSVFAFNADFSQDIFDPVILSRKGQIIAAGADNKLAVIDTTNGDYRIYDLDDEMIVDAQEQDDPKPSKAIITTLYEGDQHVLWVGTDQGIITVETLAGSQKLKISRYQNDQSDPSSLSYNHVSCFMPDPLAPQQFLWVSTRGGGLNKMNLKTRKFIRYSTQNGLPDNVVYGTLSDQNGNIWGSTNKGLFCMTPSEGGQAYTFRNFRKEDGLQEDEFNANAYVKLPDGRLAFGGVNGINVFDPKLVLQEDYKPPIYITEIAINNQAVTPFDSTGLLEYMPEYTTQLTLRPGQDILSIRYASLDFRGADHIQYRYQMKGLSDEWVEVGHQQSASFIQLNPGNYQFSVQGTNSQNQWSDQVATVSIRVLAPWYLTTWAYLLYGILIVGAIGLYYRFSIHRAKLKQQLSFEKQEAVRVRELDALKTRLFTNLTHEFRTPLTIIIGMAQQVKDNPREHFTEGVNMILKNGQNLLGLVNKMLSLSKLESGKMTLNLQQAEIVMFLRNMVESFRSYAGNKEIQLHFLSEVDELMMDFDSDKLHQVISNLISNAFKFTPEGGHVYFIIRQERDTLSIRIKDTGCGIAAVEQDKIFDRFYQTDNSSTRLYEGTGIGLALCKDLITLMDGQISVQSPPTGARKGTEFTVILPIRREAFIAEAEQAGLENALSNELIDNKKLSVKIREATKSSPETQAVQAEHPRGAFILLVEDNADVAAYIASCLGNYQLAVAENGQEGLEMATELIPDLIISDVMMPIMNGFELCQQLKSDERTAHIPIILLTARADMDSKLEGLEQGANAYLPKPFDKQELLLNIQNLFALRQKLQKHYQRLSGLMEAAVDEEYHADRPQSEDVFVTRVREIVEAHLSDFDFTVELLAAELHLSHSQFGRKLNALTGFTPNRFIRNIRLKKAKELLQSEELSITTVAYDCGFNDPSYFTRVFKKEFGKTPVEWRSTQ